MQLVGLGHPPFLNSLLHLVHPPGTRLCSQFCDEVSIPEWYELFSAAVRGASTRPAREHVCAESSAEVQARPASSRWNEYEGEGGRESGTNCPSSKRRRKRRWNQKHLLPLRSKKGQLYSILPTVCTSPKGRQSVSDCDMGLLVSCNNRQFVVTR
jgi:hypothetical protein